MFQPKINKPMQRGKSTVSINIEKLSREWVSSQADLDYKPEEKFIFELPTKLMRKINITDEGKPIFYLRYSGLYLSFI